VSHVAVIGRALFLTGILLMVSGDWPQSTLLPGRWPVPLPWLGWPWLYLVLVVTSIALLAAGDVLRTGRPTTADFLDAPLAVLTASFFLSVAFSQVPALSEWAFGCVLAVVGFALAASRIVEDEASRAGISLVIPAAALCLAVRVILWRFSDSLDVPAYHVGNNAWLGKIQITWVLNLLAPFLFARYLGARWVTAILHGLTWVIGGVAVGLLFSRAGMVAFALTTLSVCALNARRWRRWLPLLAAGVVLGGGLIIARPSVISKYLIDPVLHPARDVSMADRAVIFRQTVRMIKDHPVVGIGLGTYDHVANAQYGPITDRLFIDKGWHAHNTFLHILAETGAPGLLSWCYLWWTIARFLLRQWRSAHASDRLGASAVLAMLLAFLSLSMTEAVTAARLHASLRMNLTVALLFVYGIRLAASDRPARGCDTAEHHG
jgi:O-antigen ligase